MKKLCTTLSTMRSFAPLILRVVFGGLFLWHGIDKFRAGIDMVEGAFNMWGVPAPALAAPAVALLEVVGGIALIIGLGTRLFSMLLAVVMIGAIVYVKADVGVIAAEGAGAGAEVDIANLGGLLALMLLGPGPMSIDAMVGLEPSEATAPEPVLTRA